MKDKNNDKKDGDEIAIEVNSDLDDSVVTEETLQETVKKLREKLKICEGEKMEYLTGWQKAKADFINLRKKDEAEKESLLKFAKEDVILQIIPILDSFQLAFGNKEHWESVSKDWRTGIESIYNQLVSTLSQNGVKQEDPSGAIFDPKHAEAVGTVATDKKEEDGMVLEVLQLGYSLNGKPIRSAKVKVGQFKE
jgi:molecular chaperone GrpE